MNGTININGRKIRRVKIRNLAAALPEVDAYWRENAKCRGEDPGVFIYASDLPTAKQRKKLTAMCEGCPVVEECRYEGLRSMSDGWWGGMTPDERYEWAAETILSDKL